MDRELASTLKDLGLTATEAEIYVALLQHCSEGPVTAYKLAQEMGRDPANMTKTLAAMAKRGAVRASGRRPRLYAPVDPAEFTGSLVANLQERQRQAVRLLEAIGTPPDDESLRTLDTRDQAMACARRLLAEARRIVLVDAAPEILSELAPDLEETATNRGTTVLIKTTDPIHIRGTRVWPDPTAAALTGAAPGPWLRMTVDGHASLDVVAHPANDHDLLHGHWGRSPALAFMAHRSLGAEIIHSGAAQLLQEGAGPELARRQADDLATLILRQVAWRQRWREADLPDYTPTAAEEVDPTEVDRTMAELAAEENAPSETVTVQPELEQDFQAEMPGKTEPVPEPEQPKAPEPEAEADGPLQFIFRRRKKS